MKFGEYYFYFWMECKLSCISDSDANSHYVQVKAFIMDFKKFKFVLNEML